MNKDTKKVNKMTTAIAVYREFASKEENMTKKEFRSLVTKELRDRLKLPDAPYGTIGYYYAAARQKVTGQKRRYVQSASRRSFVDTDTDDEF